MKEITFLIQVGRIAQHPYIKTSNIPAVNSMLLLDLSFFNNNEIEFRKFINNGGESRLYKVLAYKEFEDSKQKHCVALI